MDTDDSCTSDILAALACLPFEKQAETMRSGVSQAIKHMPQARLHAIRRRIMLERDDAMPAVRSTVDLIDGQLALREIGEGAFWR